MHSASEDPIKASQGYDPVILEVGYTPDLYRKVIVSIAPGRRWTCIVGNRSTTDEQARQAALDLLAYIKGQIGGEQ